METAREEELLAMENIFGPEEFRRNETSAGEMLVCAQLPHEFTVRKGMPAVYNVSYNLSMCVNAYSFDFK